MYELLSIVFVIFGSLQIVLFFKLWGMTNDVSKIKDFLEKLNKNDKEHINLPIKQHENKIVKRKLPNNIKEGNKVIRLNDKQTMTVESIDDGQYFCKLSSGEECAYYTREEIDI